MPAMPGDDVHDLRRAAQLRPHLCRRFIFITGHSGNAKVDEFLKTVDAMVLSKPVNTEELVGAISMILKNSENEEARR